MAPPRIFISYSHDSKAHEDRVLNLADRLRADGVDAVIDQYVQSPPQGWPSWCESEIRKADFVLLVCTDLYLRRVDGEEEPGVGHGVLWEARLIKQHLYDSGSVSSKFVPVLFADGSPDHVPTPVKGATIYRIDTDYDALYRLLTNQPRIRMPEIGELRRLPERQRPSETVRHAEEGTVDFVIFRDTPLAPELVALPAREFQMGYPDSGGHLVAIRQRFAIGRYPVTCDEYGRFLMAKGEHPTSGLQPVTSVSWKDAQAYVTWLSQQTSQEYRLPSEAEWEYACRAGAPAISSNPIVEHYKENVGAHPPNLWGIYDMPPIIRELVADNWDENYRGAPHDGSAWVDSSTSKIVVRGGPSGRCGQRSWATCNYRSAVIGFRVARTLR
jgi:hypothetical protein